jgi:hypothetical protein
MNLKDETITAIHASGHTPEQIVFIGSESSGHRCTWVEFLILADREYDWGYGSQKVASDLIVVFDDGQQLWRSEFDGSEEWTFSTPFEMPEENHPIRSLFAEDAGMIGWAGLESIHNKMNLRKTEA